MDGMMIGEKEKVGWCESELSIKASDSIEITANGQFFLSNLRVIFDGDQGYFEESLGSIGITGTVKLNNRLSLMIQFSSANTFTWFIKFPEESTVSTVFSKLTKTLDELENNTNGVS